MRTILALINVTAAVAACLLVLAHKDRAGGLGSPAGRGQSLVERPLTRALGVAMAVWMASAVALVR